MKKYISILMAACLLFGSVCIPAYADGFIFDSVNIPVFEKLSRDEQEKVYPGLYDWLQTPEYMHRDEKRYPSGVLLGDEEFWSSVENSVVDDSEPVEPETPAEGEVCPHKFSKDIKYPTCEYGGYINYTCKKCGRQYTKFPDECDRYCSKITDWYEINRTSDYDPETECVKYSQIDIERYAAKYPHEIFRDFLDSYYENYIVTDAEAEKEWLDENGNMKYAGSGITTFTVEIDGVKLCLDDIRPKSGNYSVNELKGKILTYEISCIHASNQPEDADAYHYMIRFNGCDLHATGHYKAEMTDNIKRDKYGFVYYCEHVTYCIFCGKELLRIPDNTYYMEEPTQLPTVPGNENAEQIMQPTLYRKTGDVNYDTNVNAADAREVLRYSAGLSNECLYLNNADYNEDGRVTALDARMILRVAAGLSAK